MFGNHSLYRRIGVGVAATAIAVAAMSGSATAQSVTGSIQGSVIDQTGAVLPGVTVVVTNTATTAARTMVTDASGTFRAELLPVGEYDLSADLQGFAPRRQTGIAVTVGSTLTLRIEMRVSGLAESLTVLAASPILETTRSQVSSTVGEAAVQNLPVNGRNFINFALLTPGVTTRRADGRHQLRGTTRHAQQPRRGRRRQQQHVLRTDHRTHRLGPRAVPVQRVGREGVPGQLECLLGRVRPRRRRRDQRGHEIGHEPAAPVKSSSSIATSR